MNSICSRCLFRQKPTSISSILHNLNRKANSSRLPHGRRSYSTRSEGEPFQSLADAPPRLVKSNQRHGPGLIILALIPLTAFGLGTWQIYRLERKTDLIARYEDRLVRAPLPLPVVLDPEAIGDFDYRRVYATGIFRHDLEMLIGPRMREGQNGYFVVTPLERVDSKGRKTRVLVNRGWIRKEAKDLKGRRGGVSGEGVAAVPDGEVVVEGLLRGNPKGNMFTPKNRPEEGEWFFPDVQEMAKWSGSQEVWIEATMTPDLVEAYDREEKGVPIGRAAEVNLRNNHAQYIFTWYSLSIATSIMFWMVIRKPPTRVATNVRRSRDWN